MKKCDDCKGKGEIELFTSWAECEKCGGTGKIVKESDDYDKEDSWYLPAARQIGKTSIHGDWVTKPFGARHPFGGIRPSYIKEPAHKIEDMQTEKCGGRLRGTPNKKVSAQPPQPPQRRAMVISQDPSGVEPVFRRYHRKTVDSQSKGKCVICQQSRCKHLGL